MKSRFLLTPDDKAVKAIDRQKLRQLKRQLHDRKGDVIKLMKDGDNAAATAIIDTDIKKIREEISDLEHLMKRYDTPSIPIVVQPHVAVSSTFTTTEVHAHYYLLLHLLIQSLVFLLLIE